MGPKFIPSEGRNTAWICSFFNDLSDAFNGKILKDESSQMRTIMTDNSFNLQFFKSAAAQISRMRYVDLVTKEPVKRQPPTLQNLKSTIERIPLLWNKLKQLGFSSFKTVHLNQDPLENFFCRIRQSGCSNRRPTCYQFVGSFKTLVINNMSKFPSEGANCIEDGSRFALSWQNYFTPSDADIPTNFTGPSCTLPPARIKFTYCKSDPVPEKGTISTATDYVIKEMLQKLPSLRNCEQCEASMERLAFTPSHCTNRQTSQLEVIHSDMKSILRRVLSPVVHTNKIVQNAVQYLTKETNGEVFSCSVHRADTVNIFLHISVKQYIISISSFLIAI